jgi:hypothetical protein
MLPEKRRTKGFVLPSALRGTDKQSLRAKSEERAYQRFSGGSGKFRSCNEK